MSKSRQNHFFQQLRNRELTGKSKPILPVCYVGMINYFGLPIVKECVERFIREKSKNGFLDDLIAFDSEQEAEDATLKILKIWVQSKGFDYFADLITPDFLTQVKKNHLKANAYWILTIKGTPLEITALLSSDHPNHGRIGGSHVEFSDRILSAINNQADTLIIASEVRERENAINWNEVIKRYKQKGL